MGAPEYTRILSGDYPRRAQDADADLNEAAQEPARSYAESFRQSQDSLNKLLRDASGLFASVRGWMSDAFGTGGPGDPDAPGEPPQNA